VTCRTCHGTGYVPAPEPAYSSTGVGVRECPDCAAVEEVEVDAVTCPGCALVVDPDAATCPECGWVLIPPCPRCGGAQVGPCPRCGDLAADCPTCGDGGECDRCARITPLDWPPAAPEAP
jgi:hypothetical protein